VGLSGDGRKKWGQVTVSETVVCPHFPALMASKREERKQRAEAEREARERAARGVKLRNRLLVLVGALVVGAIVTLTITRRESSGRVWSAEHGHWHDK
jgi:hypothetical protein